MISRKSNFDSVSSEWRVGGVVGVSGAEESESEVGDEGDEGDRGGTAVLSSIVWRLGVRLGSGLRCVRSGYKCRDLSRAFSERKNRTAERRLST